MIISCKNSSNETCTLLNLRFIVKRKILRILTISFLKKYSVIFEILIYTIHDVSAVILYDTFAYAHILTPLTINNERPLRKLEGYLKSTKYDFIMLNVAFSTKLSYNIDFTKTSS